MNFDKIIIFKRPGENTHTGEMILDEVLEFARDHNIDVTYYENGNSIPLLHTTTLFVAIGGDGTMLRAMDISLQANLKASKILSSVVGFNGGNLGFLTEAHCSPMWVLDKIWNADYKFIQLNERMALKINVDGKDHYAINEFTFTPKNIASPLHYRIDINNQFVAQHMGSGCLVSTPTGSTAMAMSAGGAIMCPSSDALQVVPIIPHTLTSRPIITSGDDSVTLSSDMERVSEVIVSSDGRQVCSFKDNAKVTITKAPLPARIWYSARRDFFNVLSTKLDW